jgi:hypothetical protein
MSGNVSLFVAQPSCTVQIAVLEDICPAPDENMLGQLRFQDLEIIYQAMIHG